jgi:hypothetical protein
LNQSSENRNGYIRRLEPDLLQSLQIRIGCYCPQFFLLLMEQQQSHNTILYQDLNQVPTEKILNINIGLLGHIDSGKTSLGKEILMYVNY